MKKKLSITVAILLLKLVFILSVKKTIINKKDQRMP